MAQMEVQLFKKVGKYTDKKDGREKMSTRFYLKCGDALIPIEVPYFEGSEGRDYHYNGRKAVLTAFADNLPDKEKSVDKEKSEDEENSSDADESPHEGTPINAESN